MFRKNSFFTRTFGNLINKLSSKEPSNNPEIGGNSQGTVESGTLYADNVDPNLGISKGPFDHTDSQYGTVNLPYYENTPTVQPETVENTGGSGSVSNSHTDNTPDTVTEQDNKNNQIINQINALREQEIINAKNSYAQNRADYGAKAAALSAMGLTGSGYGDYLNGKAYAAYRDEVQAANAKADSSIISYQDGLNNKYLEILSELEQGGGGSVDYVTELSDQLGFSEEQKNSLVKKAEYNEVMSGLETKNFGSAAEVNGYIKSYLDSDADGSYKNKIRDAAISVIKANGFDSTNITDGYMQNALASSTVKSVSAEKYDSLKNGDDITVKINGKNYTVESGGEVKNNKVVEYAKNMKNGEIFAYRDSNDLYIYNDGHVYEVRSKHWNDKYNDEYNAVASAVLYGESHLQNIASTKKNIGVLNSSRAITSVF